MTIVEALSEMQNIDITEVGREIQALLHSRIVMQFSKLAKGGGSDRGVSWEPFKNPWYTRSDGTAVPIWGGVPKMNGKGMVKGRLRSKNPEGKKRYTPNSALMQSTGVLRQALLSDIRIGNGRIELNTPVHYAAYQDALRPWAFINQEEAALIGSVIAKRMLA